jgi:hypothetical protein
VMTPPKARVVAVEVCCKGDTWQWRVDWEVEWGTFGERVGGWAWVLEGLGATVPQHWNRRPRTWGWCASASAATVPPSWRSVFRSKPRPPRSSCIHTGDEKRLRGQPAEHERKLRLQLGSRGLVGSCRASQPPQRWHGRTERNLLDRVPLPCPNQVSSLPKL